MASSELTAAEKALVDLARVGLSEDASGLRQLVKRIARRPPAGGEHGAMLAVELNAVLAAAPTQSSPLRGAAPVQPTKIADRGESVPGSWLVRPEHATRPILPVDLQQQVDQILAERRQPERLAALGLVPTKAVLMTGPPGVGKTMAATFVASALNKPLRVVNIADLVSSLLGRTAQNLQEIIGTAAARSEVLFLDEFDALAKRRDDSADIGELRRLVNALLQMLDRWPDGQLLLAATNHADVLDPAVYRRFDLHLEFPLPDLAALQAFTRSRALAYLVDVSEEVRDLAAVAGQGGSIAELEHWLKGRARLSAVRGGSLESSIIQACVDRFTASTDREYRSNLALALYDRLGFSTRKIGQLLGVSHVTVGKDLVRARAADLVTESDEGVVDSA